MTLLDDLLAAQGKSRLDLNPRSRLALAANTAGVQDSPEVRRVLALPRCQPWLGENEIAELSRALCASSVGALRPLQAQALVEATETGGLAAKLGVGLGKTLITGLLPTVLGSLRPLLLVPKSLIAKTLDDFDGYRAQGWRIRKDIQVLNYELISHIMHADDLFKIDPDLLMCDEAHVLRNMGAACTRRVHSFVLDKHPIIALLSGTLQGRKLVQLWHMLQWTHGPERAPIPRTRRETEHWARAIDDDEGLGISLPPGALAPLGEDVSKGYRKHLHDTPGVVASDSPGCPASIRLSLERTSLPRILREHLATLRATGCRPDGIELEDAQLAECELDLSLGFWRGWKVTPPKPWLVARRNWYRLVREVLAQELPGLDSPLQVFNRYADETAEGQAWQALRYTFKTEAVVNWVTTDVVTRLVESCHEPTLIWTSDVPVGRKLEAEFGLRYYGEQQMSKAGHLLEAEPGTIALSIQACHKGVNLQHNWSNNLVLTPMASESQWEQLIGRTHREGQKADEIKIRVHAPTERARRRVLDARSKSETHHRLCLADLENNE